MEGTVRASNGLMDSIAKESQDQAAAIEEVNASVRQLDEMTQHNAALVEETNAAIEQTESQATELDRIVDIFTIEAGGAAQGRPANPPAPRPPAEPAKGIKAMQERVKTAARAYLSKGNTAVDEEWAEF